MMKLEQLMQELCPDGVEYKKLIECISIQRGTRVVRSQLSDDGQYPVYQNSLTPLGYHNECNCRMNTTFIIVAGAAGDIGYSTVDFWAADDCFCLVCDDNTIDRYIYHVLLNKQPSIYSKVRKASIPRLGRSVVENIIIPLPPLEVQAEIVRILDKFTELTTELATELTNRKKQFEYYRDSLLSYNGILNADVKTVGELSKFRRGSFPQPYGNKEWYDGEGAMPFVQVADIGDNMRLVENTKRKISILAQPKSVFAPKGSIIISLQGSIGRIAVTQYDAFIDRTVAIFSDISDRLLPKYFVYQLQRIFSLKEKTARGSTIKTITKEEFTSFPIPILPLTEQQQVVNILDRFDRLCNDISEGLPAEIEARQKQYEYYREKLLTFKEVNKQIAK